MILVAYRYTSICTLNFRSAWYSLDFTVPSGHCTISLISRTDNSS